jgi:hypothetical protein
MAGTRGNQLVAGTFGSVDDVKQFESCSRLAYCLSTFSGRAEPNRSTQAGCRAVQLVRGAGLDRFLRGKLSQSI